MKGPKRSCGTVVFHSEQQHPARDSTHSQADCAFQPLCPCRKLPALCKSFMYSKERFYPKGHKGRVKALFSRNFERSIPSTHWTHPPSSHLFLIPGTRHLLESQALRKQRLPESSIVLRPVWACCLLHSTAHFLSGALSRLALKGWRLVKR